MAIAQTSSVVKASSKYQIAIPKAIRRKLDIRPGQRFLISERDGNIVVTPVPADPIRHLRGILSEGPSVTEELLAERRRDLEHE